MMEGGMEKGKEHTMKGKWARGVMVALAASLLVVPAQAKETEAKQPEMRVEVRAQKPGEEPAVRIWINGKEVKPGEPVPAGAGVQISVHALMDPDGPGGEKVHAGVSSAQCRVRVEARAEKPGEQPKVRMWVNGKEVEPGKNVGAGEEAQVRVYSFTRPGRKDDDRPDKPHIARRTDKERGVLGVMIAPLDDATAERADVKAGAVVQGTTPGSVAEKAGLEEGDVITRADGKRIESPQQLAEYIGDRRPGDRVRIEWSRDGRRMSEDVILGRYEGSRIEAVEREAEGREEKEAPPEKDEPQEGFLGIMISPLTDDIREFAGTDRGVLINSLTDESPAAKAGLQAGDVITHVDDREVGEPGDLVEAMRERKAGDRVHVVYFRKGERREARVRLGERPGEGPRRKEGMPLFDLPGDLFGNMPELRKYFEQLRPDLEEWAKRFREQQGPLRPHGPGPAPQFPRPAPAPKIARPKPEREPYDVGKDIGRILERLERIERRLDEMEKRLGRRER